MGAPIRQSRQSLTEREYMQTTNSSAPEKSDPNGLATYLQLIAEQERSELTRQLHDNLGGLLVAALMDVAWTQMHLPDIAIDAKAKLQRARQYLSAAVDLKRKLIEELRPSLLDNVGLFAALRWQMKKICADAGVSCVDRYPEDEPHFSPDTAIGLFRFAQETLHLMVKPNSTTSVAMTVGIEQAVITLEIAYVGVATAAIAAKSAPELASLRHRIRNLEGEVAVTVPSQGGMSVRASVPMSRAAASG
jgi:signal transduction histidine kinase